MKLLRPGALALNLAMALVAVLLTVALFELVATLLYRRGVLEPESLWLHARTDPRGHLRYDPIRGSWLSDRPARFAIVTSAGDVETRSVYRGNRQGFPDRDDFEPRQRDPATRRFAVFGDSFTAAQYLPVSWPDRAEDLGREAGRPVELLNFSLDGGGLGNWTSVLVRFVQPEGYELDGVIFAVWGEDLKRRFGWWDDAPRRPAAEPEPVLFGRPLRWGLGDIPATREAALDGPHEESGRWFAVTEAQLDAALRGAWTPPFERSSKLYLWSHVQGLLRGWLDPPDFTKRRGMFHAGQQYLIRRIRRSVEAMGLPVLVVRVPNRHEHRSWEGEAEAFARILGATFVDGGEALAGLGARERAAAWMPVDGHWSQEGSDRFAGFMADVLRAWPAGDAGERSPAPSLASASPW